MYEQLAYDSEKLYNALSELSIISARELDAAWQQSRQEQKPLGPILLDADLITDDHLGQIIAQVNSFPFIKLTDISIPQDVLTLIPEQFAKKNGSIVFRKDTRGTHVAMMNPKNLEAISFIGKKTGSPAIAYYATEKDIRAAINRYTGSITSVFDIIMREALEEAHGKTHHDPPIIKIVNTILVHAYENKASDIHIEPQKTRALIRFRIDGILHDIFEFPNDIHEKIVVRIKVLSNLRTDEHQAPQDGKLQFKTDDEDVDVRVSIVPITEGEKIVMRLLAAKSRRISLTDLGFSDNDLSKIRSSYKKPYGMILATGPTGSGKTTTMYAILKLLNKREVNIMTIEDPVEYEIQGISQIQVNPKTNLTFAEGLRSIVRQDPNVILVGEIRDQETASIAVNAAMTGHLVLSTLHTNDAGTAIPRLLDMGIEPFLIASSVNIIIAQRLVRKIHSLCRVSEEMTREAFVQLIGEDLTKAVFGDQTSIRLYKGKGCDACHNTGYEGRVGIYELLVVDDDIRHAIVDRKDASQIQGIAIEKGMSTMIIDGLRKVSQGNTTIEEIMRVTKQ